MIITFTHEQARHWFTRKSKPHKGTMPGAYHRELQDENCAGALPFQTNYSPNVSGLPVYPADVERAAILEAKRLVPSWRDEYLCATCDIDSARGLRCVYVMPEGLASAMHRRRQP